jgi:hypothetical protein
MNHYAMRAVDGLANAVTAETLSYSYGYFFGSTARGRAHR